MNVIFDPEEYIQNGGHIETVEFKEIKKKKRKRNLKAQKLYGLVLLFFSCGIMLLGKIVPEVLLWVLLLGTLGIVALISKHKIIF